MELPTFEFLIDDEEDSGVKAISLVTSPAMQSRFIPFDSSEKKNKYVFLEKDEKKYKGILGGLSMIPDKLIYRIDDETHEEYNGFFSADTIEAIRNRYHKQMMTSNVNLEHQSNVFIDAYLVESYIIDTAEMLSAVQAKGITDAVIGAWFTAFKVENKEVFEACLNGEFQGFSVEAFLNRELRAMKGQNNNKFKQIKQMKKNLVDRIKEKVNLILETIDFTDALVPELGFSITYGVVGEAVTKTYTNAAGQEVTEPVGAGEFVVESGETLVVDEASVLIEIRPAVAPVADVEVPVEVPVVEVPLVNAAPEGNAGVEELPIPVANVSTKTLEEIVDVSKDGEYVIKVVVVGGVITEAIVDVSQNLIQEQMRAHQSEVLKAEIEALKQKLLAPIAEPRLFDEPQNQKDIKELTVYERVASRKGLPIM